MGTTSKGSPQIRADTTCCLTLQALRHRRLITTPVANGISMYPNIHRAFCSASGGTPFNERTASLESKELVRNTGTAIKKKSFLITLINPLINQPFNNTNNRDKGKDFNAKII